MTIIEAHAAFCEAQATIKNVSPRTVASHRATLHVLLSLEPTIVTLADVTPECAFRVFYRGRHERSWNANTTLTYMRKLNVFFVWAVKNRLLTANPLADLDRPRLGTRLPRRLTTEQTITLLEAAAMVSESSPFLRARNQAILATFIFTGVRRSELLNLKYTDVDLDHGVLSVCEGKGRKDRLIPISNRLAGYLRRYRDERAHMRKACPMFFTSERHDQRLANETLKRLVQRLTRYTGIAFGPHMLRHTFATLMLEGGSDIYALSRMMGHNDIRTTTIYLSTSVEHLKKEIARHPLDRLARPQPTQRCESLA